MSRHALANEPAERLREYMRQRGFVNIDHYVDAALAAERRATVERIRAALGVPLWHTGSRHSYFDMESVLAILDAAARP